MKEIFKDIPEYEGNYQISNFGNVKSVRRYKWNGYVNQIIMKKKLVFIIKTH